MKQSVTTESRRLFQELDQALTMEEKPSLALKRLAKTPAFGQFPFGLLLKLKGAKQSPQHHPEGSAWNHTLLVVDQAAMVKSQSKNPRAFMWGALLHDIGKPDTTRIHRGRITAYDHDKVGERIAVSFLRALTEDRDFIREVAALVRWHMQVMFVVKDLPYTDLEGMRREADTEEIALLGLCDRLGRLGADRQDAEEKIETFLRKVEAAHEVSGPAALIKLTHTANAGVLLACGGVKVFIDGIHEKRSSPFSPVPQLLLEEILHGRGDFGGADYLLVTHFHEDHFSPGAAAAYLENNRVKAVVGPKGVGALLESRRREGAPSLPPVHELPAAGEGTLSLDGMRLRYFPMAHMGEEWKAYPNLAYLLEIGGLRFFHGGDAAVEWENFSALEGVPPVEVALMNFPFAGLPKGREIIQKILRPACLVIQHLPFGEDDRYGYRSATLRSVEKYLQGMVKKTVVFTQPGQTEVLTFPLVSG